MGSFSGVMKAAARRIGISIEDYEQLRAAGRRICRKCREWKVLEAFGSDRSRGAGKDAVCLQCHARDRKQRCKPCRRARSTGLLYCASCRQQALGRVQASDI